MKLVNDREEQLNRVEAERQMMEKLNHMFYVLKEIVPIC